MSNVQDGHILHILSCIVVVIAGFFCIRGAYDNNIAILLATFFLIAIVITDILYRRIPNLVVLFFLLCGLALNSHLQGHVGLLFAAAGLVTGLILLLPVYLLGGMGAGDVKALAALGALIGPGGIFQTFLYIAIIGGIISALHYALTSDLRQKLLAGLKALQAFLYTRDLHALAPKPDRGRQRLPYAAAIALGFFAFIHWGPIVSLPR